MTKQEAFLSVLLAAATIGLIVLSSILGHIKRRLSAANKALANDPKRIGKIAELEYESDNKKSWIATLVATLVIIFLMSQADSCNKHDVDATRYINKVK